MDGMEWMENGKTLTHLSPRNRMHPTHIKKDVKQYSS
jgi:hypothetical protein